MLENIKSKYILELVFENIKDERKLFILKYNKNFKDKLNINLVECVFLSGRYFLGNKNGKGEEYNGFNDELIFEGDYIDGKRNGYGKEYYEEKYNNELAIKYEGKYLNGKRNGKGKEYYYNGKIKFDGIYSFGLKYEGKGYDQDGNIIYKLKNGKGYIKEVSDNNYVKFEGEYPNGKGIEYYFLDKNKIKFEGYYINGIRWNGIGLDEDGNKIYELKNGRGYIKEFDYYYNLIYEGEYTNGKRNGNGNIIYVDYYLVEYIYIIISKKVMNIMHTVN